MCSSPWSPPVPCPRAAWGPILALATVLGAPAGALAEEGEAARPPALPSIDAPAAETPAAPPPLATIETPAGQPLELEVRGTLPVLGSDPVEGLRRIPGAGGAIDVTEVLRLHQPTSAQDVLRGRPGVHVRTEDPSGVILNAGFRGLNPDRSEKLLILEDGVPAGLAPYIENAAYYVPPIERMARVEILKGASQILYGPQTVGGVVNFLTPDIPRCPTGRVRLLAGSDAYLMAYAEAGGTCGRLGWLVQGLGKSGDGFRDHSEFDLIDLTAKLRWTFTPCTNLTLKVNAQDLESHQTYLGLTVPMYAERYFQNPAEHDLLEVDWRSVQATLEHRFHPCLRLLANVYWSGARRDWNRQDFARNTGFAAPPANTVRTFGDTTVDGGAIFLRSSFGSRDRDFQKWGIEPRLVGSWYALGGEHDFHVGARFHKEKMIEERNNRTSLVVDPVTRDRDVRTVDAVALFGNTTLRLAPRLAVTPGLRVERYENDRHFDVVAGAAVDRDGSSDRTEWLPGLGATYDLGGGVTAFAGVHRGFAPPRTAQAIDSNGVDLELESELSWNWEVGFRGTCGPCFTWEATGFLLDFQNQVVPANQSGGASTANTNAGETEHVGFELAGGVDLFRALSGRRGPCCSTLWLEGSYTYARTENVTPGGLFEGKELPYAPRHVGSLGLSWEFDSGWRFGTRLSFAGSQFADQANTEAPSNDGLVGRIDARWLLDGTVGWRPWGSSLELTVSVSNALDERYVASRAPEGIFPGAPSTFLVGLNVDV